MTIEKINFNYPAGTLQSVFDTQEMTALELAAKTSKKVDECVELVNGVEQSAIEATAVVDEMRIAQEQFITENADIRQQVVVDNQAFIDTLEASKTTFETTMTNDLNTFKTNIDNSKTTFETDMSAALDTFENGLNASKTTFETNMTIAVNAVIANADTTIETDVETRIDELVANGTMGTIVGGRIDTISANVTAVELTANNALTKAFNYSSSDEGLARIDYWNAEEVRVYKNNFTCKGFRYHGSNYKRFGKSVDIDPTLEYPKVNFKQPYIETGFTYNQWYAVFGIVKEGETFGKLVTVPFLRIHSIIGNALAFAEGGMNGSLTSQKTYSFKNLTGHEVLIINENHKFSGVVKHVTSNTESTITLDSLPPSLTSGDFILPAPQLDDYVYLGSFYVDSTGIFNRGESCDGMVNYRGVEMTGLNIAGNISTGVYIKFDTFISPLATGVYFYVYNTLSTSSVGSDYIDFGIDDGHEITSSRIEKITTSSDALRHYAKMPFMIEQVINIKSAGLGNSASARAIHVRGYMEK